MGDTDEDMIEDEDCISNTWKEARDKPKKRWGHPTSFAGLWHMKKMKWRLANRINRFSPRDKDGQKKNSKMEIQASTMDAKQAEQWIDRKRWDERRQSIIEDGGN